MNRRFSFGDFLLAIIFFLISTVPAWFILFGSSMIVRVQLFEWIAYFLLIFVYAASRIWYLVRLSRLPKCKAFEVEDGVLTVYGYHPEKGHHVTHEITIDDIASHNVKLDFFSDYAGDWYRASEYTLYIRLDCGEEIYIKGYPRSVFACKDNLINYPFHMLRLPTKTCNSRGFEIDLALEPPPVVGHSHPLPLQPKDLPRGISNWLHKDPKLPR